MHGDLAGVTDDLVVLIHVRRPEVDEDVDDEHDVDGEVDDSEWIVVAVVLVARAARGCPGPPAAVLLVEEEGGDVGGEDGRVDDQDEDEPVPHRLEGRVVQDGEAVHAGRLQLVLRQHIRTQRQHLQ